MAKRKKGSRKSEKRAEARIDEYLMRKQFGLSQDIGTLLRDQSGHDMFEGMQAAAHMAGATTNPEAVARFDQLITELDPIASIGVIGGLLTHPELGANAYRLEYIQMAILSNARGSRPLDRARIQELFTLTEKTGRSSMEDPAEDLFVGIVFDDSSSYRIFEGLWEGNSFFLQRFIDVVSGMPQIEPFETLKGQVHALLQLSEAIACRRNLDRYTPGAEFHISELPDYILDDLDGLAEAVIFTEEDLNHLGVRSEQLSPYLTALDGWNINFSSAKLEGQFHRYPILKHDDCIIVLSPSHLSACARYHILQFANNEGCLKDLQVALAASYSKCISETLILGKLPRLPTPWRKERDLLLSSCMAEVDSGRFIHFVFAVDGIADASEYGLCARSPSFNKFDQLLKKVIRSAVESVSKVDGFREAITLIVTCGWGRGVAFDLPTVDHDKWRVNFISAEQLITLSMVESMEPLNLFRIMDHVEATSKHGVHIRNINGLLNLFAWALDMDHHLVPHDQIDGDMASSQSGLMLLINQNSLLSLRKSVAIRHDIHLVLSPDGSPVRVARYSTSSYFPEDEHRPLYVAYDDMLEGCRRSVYIGDNLNVWLTVSDDDESSGSRIFTLWDSFGKWLEHLVPAICNHVLQNIHVNLHWHIDFPSFDPRRVPDIPDEICIDKLMNRISLDVDRAESRISMRIPDEVCDVFYHPSNISETAILRKLVHGISMLIDLDLDDGEIVGSVAGDPGARQYHMFSARDSVDYLSSESRDRPIKINLFDDAMCRIGLSGLAPSHFSGSEVVGVKECTSALNAIVLAIRGELSELLSGWNREAALRQMLKNLELLRSEGVLWERTYRAILSLHQDTATIHEKVAREVSDRNAASITSRILAEMAVCDCPVEGGAIPGMLDMSRAMAKAGLINQIGGWSDSIHEGALEPKLKVTSLGLVLVDGRFHDEVLYPIGYEFIRKEIGYRAEQYEEMIKPYEVSLSVDDVFEVEFLEAWNGEFGFTIDQGQEYTGAIENLCIERGESILMLRESDVIQALEGILSEEIIKRIHSCMTLTPRESWDEIPPGMTNRDIMPWEFRRRMSLIYRPLLCLDQEENPLLLISSSLLRDGYSYRVNRSYRAEYDEAMFGTKEMKCWVGAYRNRVGHEFNDLVRDKLQDCGWYARSEVALSEVIGGRSDDADGDIDVLAWNSEQGRVLVIECKDLLFAKTPGEVARQLGEFRDDYDKKGKPDRLRRHLDRVRVLRNSIEKLSVITGLPAIDFESLLVFRNEVPMSYTEDVTGKDVSIQYYDTLDEI